MQYFILVIHLLSEYSCHQHLAAKREREVVNLTHWPVLCGVWWRAEHAGLPSGHSETHNSGAPFPAAMNATFFLEEFKWIIALETGNPTNR